MRKIAFDLDGVLVDSLDMLRRESVIKLGKRIEIEDYDILIDGVSPEGVSEFFNNIIETKWKKITPLDDADILLYNFHHKNPQNPLFFVTARPSFLMKTTNLWLKKHLSGIPFECYFEREKAGFLKDNGFDFFIDDNIKNVDAISETIPYSFLLENEFNCDIKTNEKVYRTRFLMDFINFFEDRNWK